MLLFTWSHHLSPVCEDSPSTSIHGASLCSRIEMVAFSILPSIRRHNNRLSLVIIFFFATRTKSIPFNWPNNRNEWRIDEHKKNFMKDEQRMNSIYGLESCMWQPETAFLRRKPARQNITIDPNGDRSTGAASGGAFKWMTKRKTVEYSSIALFIVPNGNL